MNKSTGPLSPVPNPLEAVHDEVASAIANATPLGAFEAGFRRLQALASEHPAFEATIIGALKNLRGELVAFAATSGGPRIAARLGQLELEMRARVGRSPVYVPTPDRPSVFGPTPKPRVLDGRSFSASYPHLDSSGNPRVPVKPE